MRVVLVGGYYPLLSTSGRVLQSILLLLTVIPPPHTHTHNVTIVQVLVGTWLLFKLVEYLHLFILVAVMLVVVTVSIEDLVVHSSPSTVSR